MSKQAVAKQDDTPGRDVALSDDIASLVGDGGGRGVSTKPEDNIVPLVRILQSNSPQCIRGHAQQVEGAEPGDFWLKDSGLPTIPGDTGMLVMACAFDKMWVEWQPDRAGFVAQHKERPAEARMVRQMADGGEKNVWEMLNGNTVVETRYHYLIGATSFYAGRAFVLPLSSTGHTASKKWMALQTAFRYPNGKTADAWARHWLLTSYPDSRKKGNFFSLRVEDRGWVTNTAEWKAGEAMFNAITTGEKTMAAEDTSVDQRESFGDVPF